MNTRTILIGVVILVVGIALIAVGAFGVLGSTTIFTTFNQIHSGEYVSSELVLNSSSAVVVSSPATTGGLIPSADLNLVNSSSIGQYALQSNSSGSSTQTYKNLTGSYYYVAFVSAPNTKIVATSVKSSLVSYGLLVLAGVACFFAGIVVAIVGVVRKSKKPKEDETYHHKDELLSSKNPNSPNPSSS
jgi:hypothetical protein